MSATPTSCPQDVTGVAPVMGPWKGLKDACTCANSWLFSPVNVTGKGWAALYAGIPAPSGPKMHQADIISCGLVASGVVL